LFSGLDLKTGNSLHCLIVLYYPENGKGGAIMKNKKDSYMGDVGLPGKIDEVRKERTIQIALMESVCPKDH
jgi:hypothetical protein